MRRFLYLFFGTICLLLPRPPAAADEAFRFENIRDIGEMGAYLEGNFPVGAPRGELRAVFVGQGGAALIEHPEREGVEKYIYDINLCRYYVWRWNISADYGPGGKLEQLYMNGNPMLTDGKPKPEVPKEAEEGKTSAIYQAKRPRPEADKGESELTYILFDRDGDPATISDRAAIGAGPTRADPLKMGMMAVYTDVAPWRSIFDADEADRIVDYVGDCAAVDAKMEEIRAEIDAAGGPEKVLEGVR